VLAAAGLVAVPAAPAVVAAEPARPVVPPKPFSAGTIQLDAGDLADGQVLATASPVPGLGDVRITFAATGDAEVTATGGPVSSEAGSPAAGDTLTATVDVDVGAEPADPAEAVLADASGSTVTATLRGEEANGATRTASDTVWVDDFRGRTLVSESGEQDLRLQRVDVVEEDGTVSTEEADDLRARIEGGGAEIEGSVTPGTCADLCVSGVVSWTDREGSTHAVDRAPVQVWDDDPDGDDDLLATTATDATGAYRVEDVSNTYVDGPGGQDVYVRVLAEGPGFTIAAPSDTVSHHIDSLVTVDVPSGSEVTEDLTATNVTDNNTAFAVRASLVYAHDGVAELNGSALDDVEVVFPDPDGSFYDGDQLHLVQLDRWDGDVALHEYGHYVADVLNIEDNPGGPHGFSQNLSDARRSKSVGIRLAWGEGWPTYFAVSVLRETASAAGIPDLGDARYQDTEDSTLDVSLEGRPTLGEDNERTVMNILWDLYDAHDDGRDRLSLGAQSVWDILDDNDPTTLSAAYRLLSPNRTTDAVNCIFTDMNVSPRVDRPVTVGTTPPTFRWRRGNGGTHRNDSFSVVFRAGGGARLFASPYRDGTSYRPPAARWTSIRNRAGGTVRVSIVGRQVDSPATGPYRGCTKAYPV
jgi:hypothetical protein